MRERERDFAVVSNERQTDRGRERERETIKNGTLVSPSAPSLISLMVSVDVKHHVYVTISWLFTIPPREQRGPCNGFQPYLRPASQRLSVNNLANQKKNNSLLCFPLMLGLWVRVGEGGGRGGGWGRGGGEGEGG